MSTSTSTVSTTAGSPISVSGLASGLDTKSIIGALLEAEQVPITRLVKQSERITDQSAQLLTIQTHLQQLSYAVAELKLPSLYEGTQTISSSEPARVSATISSGAGTGGYEIEVTQLANSAQRTYAFTPPAAEETLTVGGREYTLKEGASAKELAAKINGDGKATVYAAVVGESIVLSSRTTGTGGLEAITASGAALTETAGSAKEGRDAEYKVDGVAGTSTTNLVTNAIAGVTLTLESLTSAGPVTIAVNAPAPNVTAIETQLNNFIKLYNSTVEEIQTQITTKPIANPTNQEEAAEGQLFGDQDLTNLLNQMRQVMYEPIAGLASEVASPLDVGITTGAPGASGSATSPALTGVLTLEPSKFAAALNANPEGVKQMLEKWAGNLTTTVNNLAEPGATLESRVNGDTAQVRQITLRIQNMNEMLALRRHSLEQTYARLEGTLSHNSALGAWLTEQSNQLAADSKS
jgi:flagellar hook-associated protein 2